MNRVLLREVGERWLRGCVNTATARTTDALLALGLAALRAESWRIAWGGMRRRSNRGVLHAPVRWPKIALFCACGRPSACETDGLARKRRNDFNCARSGGHSHRRQAPDRPDQKSAALVPGASASASEYPPARGLVEGSLPDTIIYPARVPLSPRATCHSARPLPARASVSVPPEFASIAVSGGRRLESESAVPRAYSESAQPAPSRKCTERPQSALQH